VADVSGASVVVDSSKHASTAFLLRRAPGLDLRVVHLVRDSRGVAYSWAKRVQRPEVTGEGAEMPRYGAGRAAAKWLSYNSLFHLLAATGVPTLPLRYEQLVAEPSRSLGEIASFAGVPDDRGWARELARLRFPNRNDTWRDRVGPAVAARLEAIQEQQLRAAGYIR
jgi:hypothetical protein